MFRWNLLCLSLCLLALVLSLDTTEKSLALYLHPPFRYLDTLLRSFFCSLGFLGLWSHERCSSPLIILVPLCWTPDAAQDAVSCLCFTGMLLACVQLGVHQDVHGPFLPSCLGIGWPLTCAGAWGWSSPGARLCTASC